MALTFVVCVNDDAVLAANLMSSPEIQAHEVIEIRGAVSAADGLNEGLERAQHEIVVLVHQDVFLPVGWAGRLLTQLRIAEQWLGKVGVAGVYGACYAPDVPSKVACVGHIVDRGVRRHEPWDLPVAVETLDECLLVVPRSTPHRFDPKLGWHLYGADFACRVRSCGTFAVAIDNLCHHNSRTAITEPADFQKSVDYFREKWRLALPVVTPCCIVE